MDGFSFDHVPGDPGDFVLFTGKLFTGEWVTAINHLADVGVNQCCVEIIHAQFLAWC